MVRSMKWRSILVGHEFSEFSQIFGDMPNIFTCNIESKIYFSWKFKQDTYIDYIIIFRNRQYAEIYQILVSSADIKETIGTSGIGDMPSSLIQIGRQRLQSEKHTKYIYSRSGKFTPVEYTGFVDSNINLSFFFYSATIKSFMHHFTFLYTCVYVF